jgi:hypothetical protein
VEAKVKLGDDSRAKIDRGMLSRVVKGWREKARERKEKREMTQKGDKKYAQGALKKYF